jgi:hypothetical protein
MWVWQAICKFGLRAERKMLCLVSRYLNYESRLASEMLYFLALSESTYFNEYYCLLAQSIGGLRKRSFHG